MKRSKGITIFSWLIIVSSLLVFSQVMQKETKYLPVIIYFTVIIGISSIVTAINLLRLKKWARIAIIIISILVATKTLAFIPYSMKEIQLNFSENFETHYRTTMKEKGREIGKDAPTVEKARQTTTTFMRSFLMVVSLISLGFNIAVIRYFTRPKVKEMFR